MEARRFPEPEVVGSIPTAGAFAFALCPHKEEVLAQQQQQPWSSGMMDLSQGFDPGSIPGGCSFDSVAGLSVAQLVEHVTVDICDHRVAGSIPAAERFLGILPGLLWQTRSRQDSNLRGQSPVDFWSTPLTAWVRLPRSGIQDWGMQNFRHRELNGYRKN